MSKTLKLPIGIQNFESLRNDGYTYLDKTQQIWGMVNEGRYYFLSRPRRFGKSLLMSTIQAFFEGKKHLFDGTVGEPLFIATDESVDWKWDSYPILHLDLNTDDYSSKEILEKKLESHLQKWESQYPTGYEKYTSATRFEHVIEAAYKQTGKQVVILVDEYDKPLLQAIGNKELQDAYRATLKGFYGALKSMDGCIKFALLTGVTKFGKVSVFSDLNNLDDISMDWRYFDICGVKESDLHTTLKPAIELLAERNGMTLEDCIAKMRLMYDGYHFCEDVEGMYNPFSVLNTLNKLKFGSYWFETGTPTYLATLLVQHDYNLEDMAHAEVDGDVINSIDSESTNPIPVIYQSGYLTIKGYDERFGLYLLGFPNKEVEDGFVKFLIPYYLNRKRASSAFDIRGYIADLEH